MCLNRWPYSRCALLLVLISIIVLSNNHRIASCKSLRSSSIPKHMLLCVHRGNCHTVSAVVRRSFGNSLLFSAITTVVANYDQPSQNHRNLITICSSSCCSQRPITLFLGMQGSGLCPTSQAVAAERSTMTPPQVHLTASQAL